MDDRRTGGIVAAVTLTITAAFVAIAFLIIHTSIDSAKNHAESSMDLYASDLSSAVDAVVRSQFDLLDASMVDTDVSQAFTREDNGTTPEQTSATVTPLLARSTPNASKGLSFALSGTSHVLYRADGTHARISDNDWNLFWFVYDDTVRGDSGGYHVHGFASQATHESELIVGRAIRGNPAHAGALGVLIPATTLSDVISNLWTHEPPNTILYNDDGTVLLCTQDPSLQGSNVFDLYPNLASSLKDLQSGKTQMVRAWEGLEGILPQGQTLYEARRNDRTGCFTLVAHNAEDVFGPMRERVTTLVLALSVVMILLLLLVMFIVRWYRTRLMRVATTDELTGLANRKWFTSSFEALSAEGVGEAHLALIDVDKFKGINDTYGHASGDKALAMVAEKVREAAGSTGIAGRWGGDEFIAVLRAPAEEAEARVHQMIDAVAGQTIDEQIHVSVSVGLAQLRNGDSLERAVERADDALYVTKEGGRGFLTVYEEGVTPHMADDQVGTVRGPAQRMGAKEAGSSTSAANSEDPTTPDAGLKRIKSVRPRLDLVVKSLLEAVYKMVPFVAGGGILIALAFLIDAASVDVNTLSAETRANFGSITPIAAGLRDVGSAAFNFMLPIFAAFFARGLAGDEAFMAGFAGGFLSSQGSAGFAGAILAACVAAVVVRLMKGLLHETGPHLQRVAPVLLYPVFSLLIMYLLMTYVIDPVASAFDALLTSLLVTLQKGNSVVLGTVCGAMMATDMGGPINKAAYHFGTAAIASGSPNIMASVMVGGMVPPCGIALCMLLFRNRFDEETRDQGAATLFMGLSFITEGALPFVLTDPLRVIPSCIVGSAVAGGLSEAFGCTLVAPHGGIFVFPVVGNPLMYLVALVAGSLVCAVMLGLLKRKVAQLNQV
ncbi:MAG: diguanylate cyclase [Atopobiaceae bacterium]|nr:diguanylate cyclase [Atopobiaceae bacterium]